MVQMSQKEQDIQMMLASGCHLGTKNVNFQMERYGAFALLFLFLLLLLSLSIARDDDDLWIERSPLRTWKMERGKNLSGCGRVDAKVRREIRGRKCVRLVL